MNKFTKYNELLCEEFCKEMQKFEEHPVHNQLKAIKDLAETWADLQCIEAGYAMRKIAERKYGHECDMTDWDEEDIYDIFNATRGGRGGRRARDSRGRYTSNRGGRDIYDAIDPMTDRDRYYRYDDMDYDMDYPMYNRQGGNRGGRDGRAGRDGRMGRDMRNGGYMNEYDPDGMYMLRQDGGRPIMTPYAKHEKGMVPKKLTKEQYEEWVEDMVNADGSTGAHWTIEQTKQVQKKKGYDEVDETAFWAAMNASYSDLCDFFRKHNIDNPDAYAEYAMDFWFEDEDAVGNGEGNAEKLAAYYHYVVEK